MRKIISFAFFYISIAANCAEAASYVWKNAQYSEQQESHKKNIEKQSPKFMDHKGYWVANSHDNVAEYISSDKYNASFIYEPVNKEAFIVEGETKIKCDAIDIANGFISCDIHDKTYFKLSAKNLQKASNDIRDVVSGNYHWVMWKKKDSFTLVYTADKNLTFDMTTLRFHANGYECNANINGKSWVFNRQLSYDRLSIDMYRWSLAADNKSLMKCGGIKAMMGGFYDLAKHLDDRGRYEKNNGID